MPRMEDVKREDLDPRRQELYDNIMRARPRNTLSGPFAVWIHTPATAEAADALTNYFRFDHTLDQRLIELIILVMCRDSTVKYAWSAHEPLARAAGLGADIIDAIRWRQKPDFKLDDEKLIYQLVTELLATKSLSAMTFDRAIAAFGREGVSDVVSCAGFYGMVGMVINAFDIPPRPGGDVLP